MTQIILIGIIYYCGSSFWLNGWLTVNHPFIGATLVGIILGNPSQGAFIGAYIQLMYMSWLRMGGSSSVDSCFAGIVATAISIKCNLNIGVTIVLAYLLSLLTSKVWDIRNKYNLRLNKLADNCKVNDLWKINCVYSQPYLFLITFIPASIITFLGILLFTNIEIPETINHYLDIFAYLTPCIGIGSVLTMSLKKKYFIYYVLGCMSLLAGKYIPLYLTVIIMLVIISIIHIRDFRKLENLKIRNNYLKILNKFDINYACIKLFFFQYQSVNYERYQAIGLAHSLSHILNKLYKDDDLDEALRRHCSENYGIEPYYGPILSGVLISMEEDRSIESKYSSEEITSMKTNLMGPISATGDTLNQFLSNTIYLTFGIILTLSSKIGAYGTLISVLLINIVLFVQAIYFNNLGYKYGFDAIVSLNESNMMNLGIEIYTKLILFLMGLISVNYVAPVNASYINSLLGIGVGLLCYYLFRKQTNVLYTFAILAFISIFIVLIGG